MQNQSYLKIKTTISHVMMIRHFVPTELEASQSLPEVFEPYSQPAVSRTELDQKIEELDNLQLAIE